jgi:hypothetical protein
MGEKIMLVLPVDGSRPLLILKPPEPQFKDKEKKVPVTDRVTGAPMVEVPVALTMDEGMPQLLRVAVPAPGVPANLVVGAHVKATGLTFITGEKNGRSWMVFKASALTPVKG